MKNHQRNPFSVQFLFPSLIVFAVQVANAQKPPVAPATDAPAQTVAPVDPTSSPLEEEFSSAPPTASEKPAAEDRRVFRLGPSVGTDFPFWLGADLRLMFFDRLMLNAGVGSTLNAYSSLMGQTAASVGGNAAYKPVVEALYQSNSIFRVGLEYRFRGPTGWALGLNYYRQATNGEAKLADIAQATNQNFQNLLTLLNALGKSSVIRGETTMTMVQVQGSYTWSVLGFLLRGSLGVIKFTDATLKLSSQSSVFDNSAAGQATYAEAEKSLKATLVNYGVSPTAGLDLMYFF